MNAIDVIKTELTCVQRDCCRVENQCAKCDLVLPVEEIISAYEKCITLLSEHEKLENKIADIKANCDLAIEGRDVKVMELEKENERLTVSYETLKLHDEEEIRMLKSENAELKEKFKHRNCLDCSNHHSNIKLFKAKVLLKKWVELYEPKSDTALPTPIQVETEQFLEKVK